MARPSLRSSALALGFALGAGLGCLGGCDNRSTGDIPPESPQAKQAGEAGRKAMEEFIKSKSQARKPAARKAGP